MSEDVYHLGIKALLRNAEGNILLLKVNPLKLRGKQDAYWDLAGGRVQTGDSVLETLTREVAEETGIQHVADVQEIGMVLSNIRIPVDAQTSVGLILGIYACTVPSDVSIVLSDEHTAFQWFLPQEASTLLQTKYPAHFCALIANLAT